MFRWKLLHFILPNKVLLKQWTICQNSDCNHCNITEEYEHFFITCHFLDQFWKDVFNLLEKVKLGKHILTLKNLIWGYKINDIEYYDINFFRTVIICLIHKIHCLLEFRTKNINVFSVFLN